MRTNLTTLQMIKLGLANNELAEIVARQFDCPNEVPNLVDQYEQNDAYYLYDICKVLNDNKATAQDIEAYARHFNIELDSLKTALNDSIQLNYVVAYNALYCGLAPHA